MSIAVAGGAHEAHQLQQARRAPGGASAAHQAVELEQSPHEQRGERARRSSQVRAAHIELRPKPTIQFRVAGRLAGPIATEQRDQFAPARDLQAARSGLQSQPPRDPAQQHERGGRVRMRAQPGMETPPQPQPPPA